MSDKPKFDRSVALAVAKALCGALAPACERLIVAGSLRRRKERVGDVEILFIPKFESVAPAKDDFFEVKKPVPVALTDAVIARLEADGVLERRTNINGSVMFGPKNKLMLHKASGVPVDLFTATAENWWNYLVCRTGPAESNTRICMAAQERGWKWNPYGPGFTRGGEPAGPPEVRRMESEREVFEFVMLPFKEPWERV